MFCCFCLRTRLQEEISLNYYVCRKGILTVVQYFFLFFKKKCPKSHRMVLLFCFYTYFHSMLLHLPYIAYSKVHIFLPFFAQSLCLHSHPSISSTVHISISYDVCALYLLSYKPYAGATNRYSMSIHVCL